jgi:hypothetical protein
MRLNELFNESAINEAPLPDDWDKAVYTPSTKYSQRIAYAVERAQKMGKGSSRTVFEIEYQGRPTILKVAHNIKGMAQNEAEANILNDGYVQQIGIAIPLIDYDEEHPQPVWIHMEKAQRATQGQLSKMMQCGSLHWLVATAVHAYSGKQSDCTDMVMKHYNLSGREEMDTFFEYVDKLQELMSMGVALEDFTTARNWGLYNGSPVVIDLGFNDEISKKYYR